MDLLLYSGEGTNQYYISFLIKLLTILAIEQKLNFKECDHITLNDPNFTFTNVFCIVIPGGHALKLLSFIKPLVWKKIIQFIKCGGKYIGICAGAIIAAQTFIFMNTPFENPWGLNLYRKCYGVDYIKQDITLDSGEKAVYDHSPNEIIDSSLETIDKFQDKTIIARNKSCLFIGIHLETNNSVYFNLIVKKLLI
jgi:glutamine amidotransferase PdxT